MNEAIGNGTSGAGMPKYQSLIEAANDLNGVISHLKELQASIGMSQELAQPVPAPAPAPNNSAPTLVSMLNELPDEIRGKISEAHDMINRTIQALS